MFAAWEVGVWKALEPHWKPDLVVGASAGAWIAWAIAGGASAADLIAEWGDPTLADVMQLGLHSSGILRPDALHEKARHLHARFHPLIPCGLTMVEVPSLALHLARDREITWEHLAASASIPLCFPPVKIDGRFYVDGGFRGSLPLWAAEEMGATRAIALNCLTLWQFRVMRAVMQPRQPTSRLQVVLLEPSQELGPVQDGVVWNAANIRRWIELGEQDGINSLTSITM
jgi:NTE family protein